MLPTTPATDPCLAPSRRQPSTTVRVTHTERIRRLLYARGPMQIKTIARDLGINVNTVRGSLGRLVKQGVVVIHGRGLYNGI